MTGVETTAFRYLKKPTKTKPPTTTKTKPHTHKKKNPTKPLQTWPEALSLLKQLREKKKKRKVT